MPQARLTAPGWVGSVAGLCGEVFGGLAKAPVLGERWRGWIVNTSWCVRPCCGQVFARTSRPAGQAEGRRRTCLILHDYESVRF